MTATLPLRDCGWCAEPIPATAARCPRCGELAACPAHVMELITARCAGCGRPVCPRCLDGRRCRGCPVPAPKDDAPAPRALDLTDPVQSASYPTACDGWLGKHLLGAVLLGLCFLLVPVYLLLGYQLRIARQQHAQPGNLPLPPFERWGDMFLTGAKHALSLALPVLLSILVISLPFGFVIALGAGGGGTAGGLLMLVLYVWILFVSLVYPVLMPAIEIEHLRSGSLWAGFHTQALWQEMSRHPGDYLLLTLYYWILGSLGLTGAIACGVGLVVTMPWGVYACGCLLGRYLAHQDRKALAEQALVDSLLAADPTTRRPEPQPAGDAPDPASVDRAADA